MQGIPGAVQSYLHSVTAPVKEVGAVMFLYHIDVSVWILYGTLCIYTTAAFSALRVTM